MKEHTADSGLRRTFPPMWLALAAALAIGAPAIAQGPTPMKQQQTPQKQPIRPAAPRATPTSDPSASSVSSELQLSDSVARDQLKTYSVPVAKGASVEVRTLSTSDVDLYVRMNLAPTTSTYDQRAFTASGNERLVHAATASGTLHIGVFGHSAAEYDLSVRRIK